MAHRRQSIKKIRTDKRRRASNRYTLGIIKAAARQVQVYITDQKLEEATKASRALFSKLDKATKKGLLHKNKASRSKSRITLKINRLKARA